MEETCPLRRLGPKDLSHLLLRCTTLADVIKISLVNIRDLLVTNWSSLSKSESQVEEFSASVRGQGSLVAVGGSES